MTDDAAKRMQSFEQRNAAVLEKYRSLVYDPHATASACLFPCIAFCWSDEAPPSGAGTRDSQEMRSLLFAALQARSDIWLGRTPSESNQQAWDQMRALVPNWPGFRRIVVDKEMVERLRATEIGFLQSLKDLWADEEPT